MYIFFYYAHSKKWCLISVFGYVPSILNHVCYNSRNVGSSMQERIVDTKFYLSFVGKKMLAPETMENILREHLKEHGLLVKSKDQLWTVQYSKLGGRGLFAKRNIRQGEIIFIDKPLVIGPRCYNKYLPMCVNCYKSGCPLFSCDRGCGLPVCSNECEKSDKHRDLECERLKAWLPMTGNNWSMDLLQTVVPIRALALTRSQKDLVVALQCHQGPRHGREVTYPHIIFHKL